MSSGRADPRESGSRASTTECLRHPRRPGIHVSRDEFGGQESRSLTGAPWRGIHSTRSVKLSLLNPDFLNRGGRMIVPLPTTRGHPFRNATMSDSRNDTRRSRLTGEVGIRRIGHTGEHMRSHARRLDPRARGILIRPDANFLLRQWCAHVRPTHIATTTQPLTAPVVRQPERHVRRTIVTTDIAQRLDRYAGP